MPDLLFNHSLANTPPSPLSSSLSVTSPLCHLHYYWMPLIFDFLLSFSGMLSEWAMYARNSYFVTTISVNSVSFVTFQINWVLFTTKLLPFSVSTFFCFSRNLAFPKPEQPSCPNAHYEKAILSLLAPYGKEDGKGVLPDSQVTSHLKYWQ